MDEEQPDIRCSWPTTALWSASRHWAWQIHQAGLGRDSTDLSSTSSPESGQWSSASRKRPFITECWRPKA